MYKALEVSRDRDLSQFTRLLWQQKISHRVHRVDDLQIVAVPREEQVLRVRSLYDRWSAGEVAPAAGDSARVMDFFDPQEAMVKAAHVLLTSPLTIIIVLACVVLALLSGFGTDRDIVEMFLYPDFSSGGNTIVLSMVVENFTFTQFLKMIAPVLMHGGIIHLAFNMLWFWEFGKRIEAVQASWTMLLLLVALALMSNTTQYLYSGSNFIGMSGVVYGMLSYIWMWQVIDPAKGLSLPPALIFLMLILLVLITALDLSFIADEGHLGGLAGGVILGAASASVSRVRRGLPRGRA